MAAHPCPSLDSGRPHSNPLRRRAAAVATALATVGALCGLVLAAEPAAADTSPPNPGTPPTASADSLPTVQINGVVWAQVIVGNTVYATGQFTQARPAGAAAGTSETPRSNILAYNLSTGALISSWAPTLDAQGTSIAAAADGSRIFVGGDFTSVSGVARNRAVALDPTTGAVLTGWNANVNARVDDIEVSGSTVYLGGAFTVVGNQPRSRLAAVTSSTGALLPWAPQADAEVEALVAPAGSGKVIAGGHFYNMNGVAAEGPSAIDAATGDTLSWPMNTQAANAGDNSAITSLTTDGTNVYGTGFVFFGQGGDGNVEGSFAADVATGQLVWVNGCRGDSYSAVPLGPVLYSVGHAHNCA